MPRWDPDKDLRPYEPISAPGTQFTRVMMDVALVLKEGLRVPAGYDRESLNVWCLAIGQNSQPKHFVYGHTMRECFLRLRKQVKRGLPLNPDLFPRLCRKPKRRGEK